MVFGGGILGSVCKIWGNPYLNSTTVLFDKIEMASWLEVVTVYSSFIRVRSLFQTANTTKALYLSNKETGMPYKEMGYLTR